MARPKQTPRVGVVMGSDSDWDIMQHAVAQLAAFGVAHETKVVSAHRMPDAMFAYAEGAAARGLACIIAGAGGAAHLPGMLAAKTRLPVLGVPIPSRHLQGQDSLLSIVQMPKGIPVATFAIGEAGRVQRRAVCGGDARAERCRPRATSLDAFRAAQTARASAMTLPPTQEVIAPGSWLGLLGGGQLGRMFCMAAQSMGYKVAVLDPGAASPAGSVADRHIRADYRDQAGLSALASLSVPRPPNSRTSPPRASIIWARGFASRQRRRASPSRRTASAKRDSCRRMVSLSRLMPCSKRKRRRAPSIPRSSPASSRARAWATTAKDRCGSRRWTRSAPRFASMQGKRLHRRAVRLPGAGGVGRRGAQGRAATP